MDRDDDVGYDNDEDDEGGDGDDDGNDLYVLW